MEALVQQKCKDRYPRVGTLELMTAHHALALPIMTLSVGSSTVDLSRASPLSDVQTTKC